MSAATRAVTIEDLKAQEGPFFRALLDSVIEGQRDYITGHDQVVSEFVDPRVSGLVDGRVILARCLASAWRCPENEPLLPVLLLAGTGAPGGGFRALPLEEWADWADFRCFDGPGSALPSGARVRRFLIQHPPESICREVFEKKTGDLSESGLAEDEGLRDGACLTVRIGLGSRDPLLGEAVIRAGVPLEEKGAEYAVILALHAPIPQVVEVPWGGVENQWRVSLAPHMDGSHVTPLLAQLLSGEPRPDTWGDDAFRNELLQHLCAAKGEDVTKREFLNSLANAQPLRTVLPPWLTRYFPEVETVFWCCGDPTWDMSSPGDRFALLQSASKSALAVG